MNPFNCFSCNDSRGILCFVLQRLLSVIFSFFSNTERLISQSTRIMPNKKFIWRTKQVHKNCLFGKAFKSIKEIYAFESFISFIWLLVSVVSPESFEAIQETYPKIQLRWHYIEQKKRYVWLLFAKMYLFRKLLYFWFFLLLQIIVTIVTKSSIATNAKVPISTGTP